MTNLYKELFVALIFAIIALFITEELPIYVELDVYQKNLTNSGLDNLNVLEKFDVYEEHNMLRRHIGKVENITVIINGTHLWNNKLEYPIEDISLKESLRFGAIKRTITIPVIDEIYDSYSDNEIRTESILFFGWSGPRYNGTNYYEYFILGSGNQDPSIKGCTYNNSIEIDCANKITEGNYSFLVRPHENGILGPFTYRNISMDLAPPTIIIKNSEQEFGPISVEIYDNVSGIKDWGIKNLSRDVYRDVYMEQNKSELINITSEDDKKIIGQISQNYSEIGNEEEIVADSWILWVLDNSNHTAKKKLDLLYVKKKPIVLFGGSGGGNGGGSKKIVNYPVKLVSPENNSINVSAYGTLIWDCDPEDRTDIEYIVYIYKNDLSSRSFRTNKTEYSLSSCSLLPNMTYYWYVKVEGNGYSNESEIFRFTTAKDLESPKINLSQDKIIVHRPEADIEVEIIDESGIEWLNYTIVGQNFNHNKSINLYGHKMDTELININTSIIPKGDYELCFITEDIFGNKNKTFFDFIVENSPPYKPWGLDPSEGRRYLVYPHNITLRWIGGDPDYEDYIKYTIYLKGEGAEPVYSVSIYDKLGNESDCSFAVPFDLSLHTNYTWWVEVYDNQNANNISEISSFGTVADNSSPVIRVSPKDPHIYYTYSLPLDIYIIDNESEIQFVDYTISDLESNIEVSNGRLYADSSHQPWHTIHDFNSSLIKFFNDYYITIEAINSAGLNRSFSLKFTKLPVRIILNCTGWNKNNANEISGAWTDTSLENGSHIWSVTRNNKVSYYFDEPIYRIEDIYGLYYFSQFEISDNDDIAKPRLNITIMNNDRIVGSYEDWTTGGEEIIEINKTTLSYPGIFEVTYKYVNYVEPSTEGIMMNITRHGIILYPEVFDIYPSNDTYD